VTKLGEDRQYDTQRNGREYRVVERRYSLSPERSGELRIPPLVFEGSARTGKGGRGAGGGGPFRDPFFDRFFRDGPFSGDPLGMFERGQPVSARSRAVSLNVKARPGGYAGDHWLPAEALEIADSWARDPPELRVGEPVTRTLTLQARGLSGPQIPEIEIPTPPGLRAYPEKTSSESRSDGESIFGISRQGVTLIPTRSGELVIPEIRVTWWDTAAQQERVARVAGWTMHVEGGSAPEAPAPDRAAEPRADLVPQVRRDAAERGPQSDSHDEHNDLRYLIGSPLLLALLLAGTWGLISYRRRRSSDPARPTPAAVGYGTRAQGSGARKALHRACEANDPRAAANALLDWARATWPDDAPRNLGSLSARLPGGGDQVRELERRLYAPETGTWDGASLWDALRPGLASSGTPVRGQEDALAPLYPRRG
jgi:hypothetical protein